MTILQIDSSITGDNSVSRVLTRSIVEQLRAASPGANIVARDLVDEPLDHLTLAAFADTAVLDEFLDADTIVVGAPMYNFAVPSQLKAWIDRIAVAGKTFHYTDEGPVGLAGDKRVIVAVSRGGYYDADNSFEHVEAYLKPMFNFLGIEPEFVHADGIAVGPVQREAGIASGLAEVERLAA
ncbi:FMN-dependent NADH-azoreductase [Sphingomonas xanthus]|uniref:FMN dependent NADH:quinone oxidoreductase n=2 Tax=Sphingomonas xanthus TaxID=2594473 RepID=A0A516IUI9_9SPHN|nr:FMN-dependent NADH-azoreductase [Sphingomonas xanthus]